jgi:hypothetical protein
MLQYDRTMLRGCIHVCSTYLVKMARTFAAVVDEKKMHHNE